MYIHIYTYAYSYTWRSTMTMRNTWSDPEAAGAATCRLLGPLGPFDHRQPLCDLMMI